MSAPLTYERLRDGFERWHLPPAPDGFHPRPFLNRITSGDADFHDHPFRVHSTIIEGGYQEQVLDPATGAVWVHWRGAGQSFVIDHAHRLLVNQPTLTLNYFGPPIRRTRFYRVEGRTVLARWHDSDVWEALS